MLQGELSIILLIINIHVSSSVLDAIYDAGKQVWELSNSIRNESITDSESTDIIQKMSRDMDMIHEQLSLLDHFYPSKFILDLVQNWPLKVITFVDLDKNDLFIQEIDKSYERFNELMNDTNRYASEGFEKFAEGIILEVESNIQSIRKYVVDTSDPSSNSHSSLPAAITAVAMNQQAPMCGSSRIPSDILIDFFSIVMIAEMKANAMLFFINICLYLSYGRNKGYLIMNAFTRLHYEEQFEIYVNSFSSKIAVLDSIYWRACDPKDNIWIPGETSIELDGTFGRSIFRYRHLECGRDNCNAAVNDRSKLLQCRPESHDSRSSCEGIRKDCTYLGGIEACVLRTGLRKFQYVDSTELGFLGEDSRCPTDNGYIIEDGTDINEALGACECECDSYFSKISLSLMKSEATSNRVIVGLRFIRLNQILYIQPKEATLRANAYIDPNGQKWMDIPVNATSSRIHPINRENRVFFFDDLRLPPGSALTGVKFLKVKKGNISGFAIKIVGRYFHYRTGKLFLNEELKISIVASDKTPGESLSFTPVSSLFTKLPHTATPSNITHVELQQSRLKEDFGQATLPLFDSIPISVPSPSALGGMGIFHKGAEGYAGYISLRVYGINYEKYFNDFKFAHIKNNKVFFNDSLYH